MLTCRSVNTSSSDERCDPVDRQRNKFVVVHSRMHSSKRRVIVRPDPLGLYGQAIKRTRWMPRQSEAMKDVTACDKRR